MTRGELHQLVDEIREDQLGSAAALLGQLVGDDEILSDDEIAELDAGLEEARRGEGRPYRDVVRDLARDGV